MPAEFHAVASYASVSNEGAIHTAVGSYPTGAAVNCSGSNGAVSNCAACRAGSNGAVAVPPDASYPNGAFSNCPGWPVPLSWFAWLQASASHWPVRSGSAAGAGTPIDGW